MVTDIAHRLTTIGHNYSYTIVGLLFQRQNYPKKIVGFDHPVNTHTHTHTLVTMQCF